jgi:uncharacterized protein (DUF427 family)
MVKITATLNETPLASAEKSDTVVVDGNYYFPAGSINEEVMKLESTTQTVCPWKGIAAYYNAHTPTGVMVTDVAWTYPEPKEKASNIKGYVAFYKNKGVEIKEV